jgi:hypothetical protein
MPPALNLAPLPKIYPLNVPRKDGRFARSPLH